MTMFSMKPKFNLAEFLAEPAKANSSRRRSTLYSARPPKPEVEKTATKGAAAAAPKADAP